jgi:hypothetical protein
MKATIGNTPRFFLQDPNVFIGRCPRLGTTLLPCTNDTEFDHHDYARALSIGDWPATASHFREQISLSL